MERQSQPFIRRLWTGLPVLFPIVGFFLIALFAYNLVRFAMDGVLDTVIAGGTCMELLLCALFWLFACDRRRWAAIAFIALTAANVRVSLRTITFPPVILPGRMPRKAVCVCEIATAAQAHARQCAWSIPSSPTCRPPFSRS